MVLVILGAGGVIVYRSSTRSAPVAAPPPQPSLPRAAPVEPARPPPAPAITPDAAVGRARATLTAALAATTPRIQRIAAIALARTEDPAARDVLAAQLGLARSARAAAEHGPAPAPETSDVAKLDLAYALARGGDARGRDALAAALGSPRAEVRDEAARLLALLSDPRAIPHLTDLLAVSQRRLGAAELLAHLAEPHALKILDQLRGDAQASPDDKARAIIALGVARRPEVAPELRAMLGDPHFTAFAAAALAELSDRAARPVLEHQLESPVLRVRAARALRRLEPALDARPLLGPLLELLATGRDTDQLQAAEVILLLAGNASWSAYE